MNTDLQKAIRLRLISDPEVSALVPAENVVDRAGLPEKFPSVIIGESLSVADDLTLDREHIRSLFGLHVWDRDGDGTFTASNLCAAIRKRLLGWRPELPGLHVVDLHVTRVRVMRDPDGKTAHGVVEVEAVWQEIA
jgi:hypothetical protein